MTLVLTSLVILALGVVASLALGRVPRLALGIAMSAIFIAALLMLLAASAVLLGIEGQSPRHLVWPLPLGSVSLALDGLSAWFLLAIAIVAASVSIYSPAYLSAAVNREPVSVFGALLCALVACLVLLVCAADAVLFLIGWEAMTLSAFLLVAFHHESPEVRRGAWMYLVATHMGTALCVVPLFGVLCARAHTTSFSAFSGAVAMAGLATPVSLFFLGLVGFGVKAGFMPMHVWLPAAHPVAPAPISALLSGIVVKTGIYALLRLLTWLPPLPPYCGHALLVVGVVSGVMGVLYAIAQHDLKRLLAYHTVENIGIISIGIAVGMLGQAAHHPAMAALGYVGALLHVTNHALFKSLLFLSTGAVLNSVGTAGLERLGGLAKRMPMNAAMFLIGAVAICALPPLNGFLSEWVIYGSLFSNAFTSFGLSAGFAALGIVALALMGGLALACFSKAFGVVFLGQPRDEALHPQPTPASMNVSMFMLALICVVIGIAPGLWVPLVCTAAAELAAVPATEITAHIEGILAPGAKLSMCATVLLGVVGGLVLLRRILLARARRSSPDVSPAIPTWGCGYPYPTPRMQYTASSFASSLITSFHGLLWPHRMDTALAGPFPAIGHLETHTPDMAESDLFGPMFRGVARLFAMVRSVSWSREGTAHDERGPVSPFRMGPLRTLALGVVGALRRGTIQVYLSFIVIVLVILFLSETIFSPGTPRPTAPPDGQESTTEGTNP